MQHSVSEVLKKDAIEAVAILGGRYSDLVSLVRSVFVLLVVSAFVAGLCIRSSCSFVYCAAV